MREIFGDIVQSSVHVGNGKKKYLLPVSILLHLIGIMAAIIIPLMAVGALPTPAEAISWIPVDISLPPPPPPPGPAEPKTKTPKPTTGDPGPPLEPPTRINPEPPTAEPPVSTCTGCIDVGPNDGPVLGDPKPTPPARPAPTPPPPQEPLRPGGKIQQPTKTHDVKPVYPTVAQSARVQGMVIIEATLSADGHVTGAKILRSIPLLDAAALEAVRQWEFTPTLLNGVPVPVVMTVTVNFTLQ